MTTTTQVEAVERAARVRGAARQLGTASTDLKNAALLRVADAIEAETDALLAVNGPELDRARENGLTDAFLDRMTLTPDRIAGIARDVRAIVALPDPVGEVEEMTTRPNGLQIGRMRVPLGVIGAIYESRPNVTVDIAAVCLKSGNGVLLRSGTDAHATSGALAAILQRETAAAGLHEHSVEFIQSTDRAEVGEMLRAADQIDLMVPRGGADLIRRVRDEATMPVVAGGIGVCHTYIDADADLAMAEPIVVNAKTQRPSVCNALDTLLVHRDVAAQFVPQIVRELGERGVTVHADARAGALAGEAPNAVPVTAEDYDREWLSLDCSVRVVDSLDDALAHIEAQDRKSVV